MTVIDIKLAEFDILLAPQLGLRIENKPLPDAVANYLNCKKGDLFSLWIDSDSGGEHSLYELVANAVEDEDDRIVFAGGCVKIAFNHCLIPARIDPISLKHLVSAAENGIGERVLSLDLSMMSPMEDLVAGTQGYSLLPDHLKVEAKGALFLPQITLQAWS